MNKLKIGIAGTRGVPNHYGGFEQIAGYLAAGLVERGHRVSVYNSHNHPYQAKEWNGVEIVHCYDPEYRLGTAGQFIYDFNCIRDARRRKYDVILQLGYTSSSVWGWLNPDKSTVITNMDGMEWKRDKYSKPVQRFLRYAEKLAVTYSDFLIADSIAIKSYLDAKYDLQSKYIAYGAQQLRQVDLKMLLGFSVLPQSYFLLMARMEPENNIEMILDGFCKSTSQKNFLVIGNVSNKAGKYMVDKFKDDVRIKFLGAIFDDKKVQTLQHHSYLYFHGHSVGGTNPSLLEAMAAGAVIAAHDNEYNRAILNNDAYYFSSVSDIALIIENIDKQSAEKAMADCNLQKIAKLYNWQTIIDQYEEYMYACHYSHNNERVVSH